MNTNGDNAQMKKCTSAAFIAYCDKTYPALQNNTGFRRLFFYLCFGTYEDYSGKLLLSKSIVSNMAGIDIHSNSAIKHFNAEKFLKAFQAEVLPGFQWTDFEPPNFDSWESTGKARAVKRFGISSETWDMVDRELGYVGDKFYFDTKRKYHMVAKAADRKTALEQYLNDEQAYFKLNPTQQLILDELKPFALHGKGISDKLVDNQALIESAIDSLEADDDSDIVETKRRQRAILESIREDSRIFYRPTALRRTPRLHHSTDCIISLKSAVRKAFCHGWIEADLVSSQLAILAGVLNAPITKAFVASGQSIWEYIHNDVGRGPLTKSVKSIYKRFIYSICFGKTKKHLIQYCKAYGIERLMDNALVIELVEKRDNLLGQIAEQGSFMDVWFEKHYIEEPGIKTDIYGQQVNDDKGRWAGSLLGTVIQSIEMEIISAAFEIHRKYSKALGFQITVFQHDGFTYSQTDKRELDNIQRKLNSAVQEKAREVGKRLGREFVGVRLAFEQL